jgi:hypothetical protein
MQYMRGQIVRVDPGKGVVVIRSGVGAQAQNTAYRVGTDTRYFGTDNQALANGLRSSGFRRGANVWYVRRVPPGEVAPRNLNELRLGPAPGVAPVVPGTNPDGTAPQGLPTPGKPGPGGPNR